MKKIISITIILTGLFLLAGCSIKRDNLEGIDIYTTVYPIEYITDRLYGAHSNIYSIYPDGIIIDDYTLTDKQIKDYSKASMFVFNGLDNEKDYVIPMFKENKSIKIIDSTLSMEYTYGKEELWLDPSNLLMLSQNIKNGLKEYINNGYLKNEIDDNYDKLKIAVSALDAKLKLVTEKASDHTIVVGNDVYKFLEKYNLNVISLEETETLSEKDIADVNELIDNKKISYIFLKQNEDINPTIQKLVDTTDVEVIYLNDITNITEDQRETKQDYIKLMNDNIDLLKNELYD